MKKSIILTGFCLLTLSVILSSYITKASIINSQTEEYAIVHVIDVGKDKFIRVTKSGSPSLEATYKKERTEDVDDFSPVIRVLNQLNTEGFELLNASISSQENGGTTSGTKNFFVMVKKIK